jgi:hypothetical protein
MNEKNVEFLKEALKFLGFGEGMYKRLTEEIAKALPDFKLRTENQYGPDKVGYSLDFSKSDKSNMYFFNKYTATLNPGLDSPDKCQTFYINKNSGVTAKEAYNMLNGRAVNKDLTNKEGEAYNAWMQIDWNQKDNNGNHKLKLIHQAYGFDLDKELQKHPIAELENPVTKERLMRSLERGNLHEVKFKNGDSINSRFIEANPQFKTLNVYDEKLKKIFMGNGHKYHVPESDPIQKQPERHSENEGLGKKEDAKKEKRSDDDESPKKERKGKVKMGT